MTVRDDVDREPVVVLESITCDDGCNPAADIQDAAFGTLDLNFSLRATRTGGGPGRTYTVTYSARDVAGNRTTATTEVRVPHDRRP